MADLNYVAKIIIFIGILITLSGLVILIAGKVPWLGKLPGDILIKNENFSFYFPLTTCILLSIFLTLIVYFLTRR
ncbi:MAG: DUF2905 domain-containing protein [Candidatus Omnitrophica bacterium]|nr:DUF2905 domain-containing protein [Candidatus Omnitrophota bacterium]